MATATFDRNEIDKLVGHKLDDATYKDRVPMMGVPVERIEKDEIEIEVFPNKPELFSVEGFARALRMFLFDEKPREYTAKTSNVMLEVEDVPVRPHVVAAVIKNVTVTDSLIKSLMQFQEKIHTTMGRRREKIAIGVHDMDKVEAPFTYKAVKPDEIGFVPLDMLEKDFTLNDILKHHPKGREFGHIISKADKWPIITDKNGKVLSFPPIINGELTRVTTKTKNIFIDVTGTNEFYINQALNLIVTLFAERGGEIQTVRVGNKITPNLQPQKMKISIDYVNKLLDLDINLNDLKPVLNKMGLDINKDEVIIPPYRTDILHEIDIVEDIAVGNGYEKIETKIPRVPTIAVRDEKEEFANKVRETFVGLGFQEVITSILTNPKDHYTKMNMNKSESCEIENPATEDYTICRRSLLPMTIKTFAENQHRAYPQMVFEIGDVIEPDGKQRMKLSAGVCNPTIGYEEIAATLDALMRNLSLNFSIEPTSDMRFIPGRTGKITVNGKEIGTIGEISPRVLENWNLDNPVVAFEIELENINTV